MLSYRGPSTKCIPPVPPHFVDNFLSGGWRKIERMYGARDDRLLKWIELSGGCDLYRARKAYLTGQATIEQALVMVRATVVVRAVVAA
jgi:hypothetical protein